MDLSALWIHKSGRKDIILGTERHAAAQAQHTLYRTGHDKIVVRHAGRGRTPAHRKPDHGNFWHRGQMSFTKAQDMLRLAQMAASGRGGVSLEDICAEYDVSNRTAQRMTEALDATFANVSTTDDADRRRFWRMGAPLPDRLQPRQETAIEALEIATRTARDEGRNDFHAH